ncbi:MAG: AAA family ATPase [Acidobacteria bacterium]|nr:AAA family ATPase [Acidobacteriota bacterium]
MKVSIYNFKSIKELNSFQIKPLTIIAGVNNSGKSSLFQFLLLIKQTIGFASTAIPLSDKGEYSVARLQDLVFGRVQEAEMGISFSIRVDEFSDPKVFADFGVSSSPNAEWAIDLRYKFEGEQPSITLFKIVLEDPKVKANKPFLQIIRTQTGYTAESNVEHFGKGLRAIPGEPHKLSNIRFESIFPLQYELAATADDDDEITKSFNLSSFQEFFRSFFARLYYIGPLRARPKASYVIEKDHTSVGVNGEYSAQILQARASDVISFYKFLANTDKDEPYELVKNTLLYGVKYWMCDEFGIAKDVYAKKAADVYQIFFVNELDLEITIDQVGFGVSQVLPLVIEGLRMPDNGVLMIEEPESHLHPKLQSKLFDFLYSLVKQGKTIMIETHSNHLVERMRRRVAESKSDLILERIGLSFVTSKSGKAEFELITLDRFGVTEFFPEDFIELSNGELAAIVEAQMKKRLAELNNE